MNSLVGSIIDQLREQRAQARRQLQALDTALTALEQGYDMAPLDPPMPSVLMPDKVKQGLVRRNSDGH